MIGVDFDNTLVSYDRVMHAEALRRGLIGACVQRNKQGVRDAIRQLPDGEREWQRVQALVYGLKIDEAQLIEGVCEFFAHCRAHRVPVFIVSHKTECVEADGTPVHLRAAALGWMRHQGFFTADGLGLSEADVFFESTRRGKIERIKQLHCTHCIDDLEDTFRDDSFPARVEPILFAPHRRGTVPPPVRLMTAWHEITDYFFHADR